MTTMKFKDIKKTSLEDRAKKIEELKFELVKARASAAKSGTSKAREIKKIIARILTLNNSEDKTSKQVGRNG